MEYKMFGNQIILRVERGEELLSAIQRCCRETGVALGAIQGIGAADQIEIGLFAVKEREYHSTRLSGDHEITSLTGNVSQKDGDVYLHVHATLSGPDHRVVGGHLNSAVISATCEVIIQRIEGEVPRRFDEGVGLNLLDLS
jgi:hypothetical protein